MPNRLTDEVLRDLPAARSLWHACRRYYADFPDGDVFGALQELSGVFDALNIEIQVVMREPFNAEA